MRARCSTASEHRSTFPLQRPLQCEHLFCRHRRAIGTNVHNYSKFPLIGGSAAYVVSAVVEVRGISRHMRITSGDFVADAKHTLVCACNGRFYGGGFNPSLTAMPDDGIMDIFVAKKLNILQFAALIGKYAKGRADELPSSSRICAPTGSR
ncbi:MAG: hypothetical protein V8S72_00145 [Oscillospiraceae bacterium]